MTLLGIETATDVCSVACWREGLILAAAEVRTPRSHAARLAPLIQQVLAEAACPVRALDGIAVSMGPGSYTGLRIGVSTAKGLAFAADTALVGVPSLEALAWAAMPATPLGAGIVAAFHSRRGEVYVAAFRRTSVGQEAVAPTAAVLLAEATAWWPFAPDAPVVLVGEAADALRALPDLQAATVVPDLVPSGATVAALGAELLAAGAAADLQSFEPFYLKAFVPGPARPIFR